MMKSHMCHLGWDPGTDTGHQEQTQEICSIH